MRLVLTTDEAVALAGHEPVRETTKYVNPAESQIAGLPPYLAVQTLGKVFGDAVQWWRRSDPVRIDVEYSGPEPTFLGLIEAAKEGGDLEIRKAAHLRRIRLGQMAYWGRWWRDRQLGGTVIEVLSDDGLTRMRHILAPEKEQSGLGIEEVARALTQQLAAKERSEALTT